MTFFKRFFLILFGFTALALGGTGFISFRIAQAARENVRAYHIQLLGFTRDDLRAASQRFNSTFGFVRDLTRPDKPRAFRVLQNAVATRPDLVFVAIDDPAGNEVLNFGSSRLAASASLAPVWRKLVAQSVEELQPATGGVTAAGNLPVIPVVYPLKRGHRLRAMVSLEKLWDSLSKQRIGKNGRVVLAGPDGAVLPLFGEDLPKLELPAAKEGWFETAAGGGDWIGAYRRDVAFGWTVASLEPRAEAYMEVQRFAGNAIALSLALFVLAGWLAVSLSRQIAGPIDRLIAGAARIAKADFSLAVPENGWPELRRLAQGFNHMMGELKRFNEMHIDEVVEQKAKVEAIVGTIPDGVMMTDMAGKILFSNPATPGLLGGRAPAAVAELGRLGPEIGQAMQALLSKQKRWVSAEGKIEAPGAEPVYLKVLGAMISMQKRDAGALIVVRDISIEKKLDQMKEDFFHSIVHDLRNPIGAVRGFLELDMKLRAGQMDEKQKKRFSFVTVALDDLERLVSDILDLSKIESGTYELELQPTRLGDVLERASALFQFPMNVKKITFPSDFAAVAGESLNLDAPRLERVIANLLGNAMKFTPEGGTITLGARRVQGGVQVDVTDTGSGIPSDKLGAVFVKFQQLEGEQKKKGYGLGLAICQKIVELHGGKIWAESPIKDGKGTRFAFLLPG